MKAPPAVAFMEKSIHVIQLDASFDGCVCSVWIMLCSVRRGENALWCRGIGFLVENTWTWGFIGRN